MLALNESEQQAESIPIRLDGGRTHVALAREMFSEEPLQPETEVTFHDGK